MPAQTPHVARVIKVIEVLACRGEGTEASPYRTVRQFWSIEGELLADNDQLLKVEPPPADPDA